MRFGPCVMRAQAAESKSASMVRRPGGKHPRHGHGGGIAGAGKSSPVNMRRCSITGGITEARSTGHVFALSYLMVNLR